MMLMERLLNGRLLGQITCDLSGDSVRESCRYGRNGLRGHLSRVMPMQQVEDANQNQPNPIASQGSTSDQAPRNDMQKAAL